VSTLSKVTPDEQFDLVLVPVRDGMAGQSHLGGTA
jgi:hypothetical protein